MSRSDILIVGAGLAGLSCARTLHNAGVDVRIVESDRAVGGRVQTDRVDGFLLDRGFQVLLEAYPEAKAELDYDALDLRPFYPGALVRSGDGFERVADPFRRPFDGLQTVFADVGSLGDKLRVAKLRVEMTRRSIDEIFTIEEQTTRAFLEERGFSEKMISTFFRPFMGGVLLDRELRASNRMFAFIYKVFSEGQTSVPARGMGAIPEQLASYLPDGAILLESTVDVVEEGSLLLKSGERLEADGIVVATSGPVACELLGIRDAPFSRSTTALYFVAPASPVGEPTLVLNGNDGGPVNTVAVMSDVAPSYSPDERALICVSVNGYHDDFRGVAAAARDQLTGWYGREVMGWEFLRGYAIRHAQPGQEPPALAEPQRPVEHAAGIWVCGDWRDNASINGAMVSGRRTAEVILGEVIA